MPQTPDQDQRRSDAKPTDKSTNILKKLYQAMLSEVENEEEQIREESLDSYEGSLDNNESTQNQFTPPTVYLVRTN